MAENENTDDTLSSSEKFDEESTHNDKSSKRSYKQIYRKDWESNPIFKGIQVFVEEAFSEVHSIFRL